jgi:thiamine pyrophosphokinase
MMSEFPYQNLRHYLELHGLLNTHKEELKKAKREYKKLYQRAYRQVYSKVQLNVVLSGEEFKHLKTEGSKYKLKATQFLVHLITQNKEGTSTRPNLLVDIEVGILKALDAMTKRMKSSPETKVKLIDTYRQVEELLILLGS